MRRVSRRFFAVLLLASTALPFSGGPAVGSSAAATAAVATMPLISRNVPAFASSQLSPAKSANDADYGTTWRGAIPGWLAYDLSAVPAGQRGQVIVGWYNDPITSPYDHVISGEVAYNSLKDYSIQGNAAAGGASAPTTGWVTLKTVTGNVYHSRQALVDLTGYNWIRLNVTASDGSSGNTDAALNLDVHDASQGAQDSWDFLGDSITMDGTYHAPVNGVGNFSQLVNASAAAYYPSYEDAGIGGLTSADGAHNINTWLALFPGRYVALSYGTNDANGCGDTTAFYNNYVTMVQAVLAAGKTPVVPTIPWSRTADIQSCGPAFNAKIQQLYSAYPSIVKGPDLWGYFSTHQSLISGDNLHPSSAGYAAFRQQWANAMVTAVYNGTPPPPSPGVGLAPASLGFGSVALGATSSSKSTTLQNTGTAPLTISSIAVGGANAGDYSRTTTCPLGPATLAAGATCTITVTFAPTAVGSRAANVTITDNAAGSPHTLGLTGTGTTASPPPGLNWAANPSADFDGDHLTDFGLYRGRTPLDSLWYAPGTAGGSSFQIYFGATTDIPVPGDYDGDGKTDAVIFRPSTGLWYGPRTGAASIVIQMMLGQSGDIPVPGDYDGDGKTDPAIYRPSTGMFFAVKSGGGTLSTAFGSAGDIPVPRDYDGDGKTDPAIYRPSNGLWYAPLSGGGVYQIYFGAPTDIPVPGDYNGDRRAEAAIFRPSSGLWYGPYNGASGVFQISLGQAGDVPIPGYYDNNLSVDPAIYRPSTGMWYATLSGGGMRRLDGAGQSGDVAIQRRPTLAGGS